MQAAGGATALMYACQQCRENEVLEIIRKQPHSVREKDRTSKCCLHYCAENANTLCAEAILRAAPELADARDDNGYCPLHLAVIGGNRALVKLLIAKGADVNARDDEGHSAVHWAVVSSEKEALEMVIKAGANPSTPDIRGGYPLHYAVQMCGSICGCDYSRNFEDAIKVVETLLNFGVDVNVKDKDGRQPILWAASAGSADAIIHLVSAGACVEAADKDGLTALHCAASRGHTTTLETLISLCGAHVDVIDGNGCSALFYSVTLGHADATELLLRLGAEPNRQDRKGRTPAHCGAAKGQLETLRILQKHGGNLWLRNVKGDIPLHEAVASGRKDLVLWLLSQNPEAINLANNDGRCPLHIASMYNNTEMVKVLLDAKSLVNPVMRTSKGVLMTPLNVALCRGHRSCGKYLQLHGGVPFSKVARLEPASAFAVRVSPSDEMIKSVETKREISSHNSVPKSRTSADVQGSQESEKAEGGEKRKVYRRRRKKKSASNVPTQDSESDESVQEVKVRTSGSRKVKKSDGKDEDEEKTKTKKVQLDAPKPKTETASSKSVSGANSNKEDEVAEGEATERKEAPKAKTLHSSKSFNETKNVSDLSPEDFPPQMQTIDHLDAVILEPDIEEQRLEQQDEAASTKTADKIQVEAIVQKVQTEDSDKIEVKEEEIKKVVSSQEKSAEVSKAEKEQKADSKKSNEHSSTQKIVKSPKTSNMVRKEERLSKNSEGSESNRYKKTVGLKSPKVAAADQTEESSHGILNKNGGGERAKILNSEPKMVEETKENGNEKPKTETETSEHRDGIAAEDKNDKTQTKAEESEEDTKSKRVTDEESGTGKNDSDLTEKSKKMMTPSKDSGLFLPKEKYIEKEKEKEKVNQNEKDKKEEPENENENEKEQEKDKGKEKNIEKEREKEEDGERLKGREKDNEKEKEKDKEKQKNQENHEKKDKDNEKEKEEDKEKQEKQKDQRKNEEKEKVKENENEQEKQPDREIEKVAEMDKENDKGKEIEKIKVETEKMEPSQTARSEGEEQKRENDESQIGNNSNVMEAEIIGAEKKEESKEKTEEREKNKVSHEIQSSSGNTEQVQNGAENGQNTEEHFESPEPSEPSEPPVPSALSEPSEPSGPSALSGLSESSQHSSAMLSTVSAIQPAQNGSLKSSDALNEKEEIKTKEENTRSTLEQELPVSKASHDEQRTEVVTEKKEQSDEEEEEKGKKAEEKDDEGVESKSQKKKEKSEKEEGEEKDTEEKEQNTTKSQRVARLCRRQRDFRADVSDVSVTQLVQNTLRKYHMERGIFYQLLELKRYQIRSGKANEQVLVKRLADEYDRERVFLGMKPYSGLYKFKEFEKFLYDQLKALNARRSFLIPDVKSYDDIDALSGFLKKSRYKIFNEVPRSEMTCTCITQRCHHSACAYTSVPCSAYITDLRRHRRHKPKREGFFPRIEQPPSFNADKVAGRPATLELIQGSEKHVITLPQNCPTRGKRYYVTFTIKGVPACKDEDFGEDEKNLFKHRHAKSV